MSDQTIEEATWEAYRAASRLSEDERLSEFDRGRVDAAREVLMSVWAGVICASAEKAAAAPVTPPSADQGGVDEIAF